MDHDAALHLLIPNDLCFHWLPLTYSTVAAVEDFVILAKILRFELNNQITPSLPCFWSNMLMGLNCLWHGLSHCVRFPFTESGLGIQTLEYFLSANTEWTARRPWRTIGWIWHKAQWIRIMECSFNLSHTDNVGTEIISFSYWSSYFVMWESDGSPLEPFPGGEPVSEGAIFGLFRGIINV